MQPILRQNDKRIDELEAAMFSAAMDENSDIHFVDCPINHYFTPKLYVREVLMPSHKMITSEVHKTCHPFRVLQGNVLVSVDGGEWQTITAPYKGVTQPGTRRVLITLENTVWETFHPLDFITGEEESLPYEEMMKVIDRIIDAIIEPYENKLLGGHVFLNQITNKQKELT